METMDALLPEPDKPLEMVVTDAGSEILKLRNLAKEAIPMLLRPERHSLSQRERIVRGFEAILDNECFDSEGECEFSESEDEEDEYEPGECVKWSDWPDREDDF